LTTGISDPFRAQENAVNNSKKITAIKRVFRAKKRDIIFIVTNLKMPLKNVSKNKMDRVLQG